MRFVVLVALTSTAAAAPPGHLGDETFEVSAGPGVFVINGAQSRDFDPALAVRIGLGRFMRPDFSMSLEFVDHMFRHQPGLDHEIDSALTLEVGSQLWMRPDLFLGLGGGLTYGKAFTVSDAGERFNGVAVDARAGFAIDQGDSAILVSAQLVQTLTYTDAASTTAFSVLIGWQSL